MRARRIVLIGVSVFALLAGACADDAADDAMETPTTAVEDNGTGDSGTEATDGAPSDATVQLAEAPGFGEILVGPNGHTLYLFEKDEGTTTACTGGCANAWPALAAAGEPTAGPGIDSGLISTADAQVENQVVYNGHLLYFFAQDTAPGEVKGIDVPAWYPLNAAGEKVEGESS